MTDEPLKIPPPLPGDFKVNLVDHYPCTWSPEDASDLVDIAIRRAAFAEAEIERLRAKNTELNRRWQEADKAFREAKQALDNKWKWCGGNFGRALLAYQCSQQGKEIEQLRAELAETKRHRDTCFQRIAALEDEVDRMKLERPLCPHAVHDGTGLWGCTKPAGHEGSHECGGARWEG